MKFSILDQTGHTTELLDTSTKAELAKARARFNELVREHHMIAATKTEDPAARSTHKVIRSFDPTATEVLFIPQLKGG